MHERAVLAGIVVAMVAAGLGGSYTGYVVGAEQECLDAVMDTLPRRGDGVPIPEMVDLAIYYGNPTKVNGADGDLDRMMTEFAPFELIILSQSRYLVHPEAVSRLAAEHEVYGYIDTRKWLDDEPVASATAWRDLGATGLFWDVMGNDYGIPTERAHELIEWTHDLGMQAFVNAWDPRDVLGPGTPMGAGDWYLAEDWLVEDDEIEELDDWREKADDLMTLRRDLGIRVAAVSTGPTPVHHGPGTWYSYAWWGAAMYGLDAYQYTVPNYSASGATHYELNHHPPVGGYGGNFTGAVEHSQDDGMHTRTTDAGTIVLWGSANEEDQEYEEAVGVASFVPQAQ